MTKYRIAPIRTSRSELTSGPGRTKGWNSHNGLYTLKLEVHFIRCPGWPVPIRQQFVQTNLTPLRDS
jgi:hypothetical protein